MTARPNPRKGVGTLMKQTPWRKDPVVRARMAIVQKCWLEGLDTAATLIKVNEWARSATPGHPEFSISTIQRDRNNLLTLADDDAGDARKEHVEALRHAKKRAYEELDATGNDMAKPGLLNVIIKAEETASKIDGSLVTRTESKVEMTNDTQARILVQVLVKHLGNEELAMKVIEDVKQTLEAESTVGK